VVTGAARRLRCHYCGSDDLALNEVVQEHLRYDEGLYIDESGTIMARGEGVASPGLPQPGLTEIECLGCGKSWHPRRPFGGLQRGATS
jgi:hypothetical protein